jgi:hypothetical protein
VSGACNDANEASVVIQLQPTMTTAQKFLPNDSATISVAAGAGNLAGNVVFQLYESTDCSGTAVYTSGNVPVSGASPQTVSSNNTTYFVTSSTPLSWKVSYTSTNTGHTNIAASCHENSNVTITNGGTVPSP